MSVLPEAGIGEEATLGPVPEAGPVRAWARKLAGGKFSYALADQAIYSLGNLIVAALLSRNAAAREFGIYILTQRAIDLLVTLCNVFLWGPFTYNLPGMETERRRLYIGSVFAHQVVCCGLGAMLFWLASKWAITPERGLYYGVFAPLVFAGVGILFREYTRRMYFAEMRMVEAFWTDAVTVVLQIAGVEWLALAHRMAVPNVLWVLSGAALVVNLWWFVREWGSFRIGMTACVEDLGLNMRLGRWFFGSNMVFLISSQCNPWVLSRLLGGASVGAYAVCESVANIPRVGLNSMQNIMAPMMARAYVQGGKPALAKLVKRLDARMFAGTVLFGIGVVTMGPWFAKIVFKQLPPDASLILILLSVNLVLFASTLAQGYGLSAIDKAGPTFYANLAGLVAQVSVSVWLVQRMHVPGAAAAMMIGSVVVLVVRQIFYSREMGSTAIAAEVRA